MGWSLWGTACEKTPKTAKTGGFSACETKICPRGKQRGFRMDRQYRNTAHIPPGGIMRCESGQEKGGGALKTANPLRHA